MSEPNEVVSIGSMRDVCIVAPHGGHIEPETGFQARRVAEALDCCLWLCEAHNGPDGAFDSHHVPSHEITVDQFPKLRLLPFPFDVVVGFHGHKGREIVVGGRGKGIHPFIVERLSAASYAPVSRRSRGQLSGTDPLNIINRLSAKHGTSVQIEQPRAVRDSKAKLVADCITDSISSIYGIGYSSGVC